MKFQVFIKIPEYEKQWVRHHFGDPATFPPQSNVNNVIRHFIKKTPEGKNPEMKKDGEIAINIPESKSKDPQYYNYLTTSGKSAIAEAINDIFTMQMWEDLNDIDMRSVPLTLLVNDWMETNGISWEQQGNLYQKFTRIRETYRKHGINVSRGYKHEHRSIKKKK